MNYETPKAEASSNLEEAHEEAKMMKAVLRKEGKTSDMTREQREREERTEGRAPKEIRPEDYDRALAMVEELKRAAEEEPEIKKIIYKMGRLISRFADLQLDALGGLEGSDEWFLDAEKKLKDLKEDAEVEIT